MPKAECNTHRIIASLSRAICYSGFLNMKEFILILAKRNFLSALLAASLFLAADSVMAGGDSGFYIGGSLGRSSLDVDNVEDIDTADFEIDDDDNAYKVLLGFNFGIIPLLDLAVEAAYRDFGEFEGRTSLGVATAEADAVDVFGIVALTFGPLAVFGKAGIVDWDVDTVVEDGNIDRSGSDPAYGIGARFQLGSFAIRGEYETFEIADSSDLSMLSVGLTYTF